MSKNEVLENCWWGALGGAVLCVGTGPYGSLIGATIGVGIVLAVSKWW